MTTWPVNAQVGQRVVCIYQLQDEAVKYMPEKGKVYTIREIVHRQSVWGGFKVGFLLKEIVNPVQRTIINDIVEVAFIYTAFRPVDETKIDVFRKIAANPRVPVDA
jgi:hypothetical protein